MRHRILLLVVASAAFGGCTTMYKSGQTPDDVYFSPGREVPAYVETKTNPEESAKQAQNEDYSDSYLRMKTYDRARWSAFDNDYMYWNDWRWNNQMYYNSFHPYSPYSSWGVGFGTGYSSGWSFGMSYNWGMPYYGYYSPFCPGYYGAPVIIVNPKTYNPKAYAPRGGNLNAYNTARNVNAYTDPHTGVKTYNISTPSTAPMRTFSGGSSGNSRSSGYYNTDNSSSRPRLFQSGSSSSPTRSYDRSSSPSGNSGGTRSSGSSGGGGGGSAPVRSFPRGGGR
jgi:hypothetical protein